MSLVSSIPHSSPSALDTGLAITFAGIAASHAESPAIQDERVAWTYRDLHDQVTAYDAAIRTTAPSRPSVIAILLPTDARHVAAVMSVLRAGHVYLSLDPTYPAERLCLMAQAAEVSTIVTSSDYADVAAQLPGVRRILDLDRAAVDAATPDPVERSLDAIAALYFTSGSTGMPKAVAHTQRTILSDIRRQTRDMGVTPRDRFDLVFSASFSAFLSPVFGALLTGASVHPFELKKHPIEDYRDWLSARAITIATQSVSTFRHLVSALPRQRTFPGLRMLSLGAEPLLLEDVRRFRAHFAASALLQNALATTETRTIAQRLVPADGPEPATVSVGWPVEGKSVQLLDPAGKPVAPGEPGEIVVTSDRISPGRWEDLKTLPDLTLPAPRTVKHRTGDLARWLPDGSLEHLGRTDDQMKIRGYRVAPLEIENCLLQMPGVRHAAVTQTRDGAGGRDTLVGLVVASATSAPTTGQVRAFAASRLPEHMVPAQIHLVDTMPLTPSGKLDRKRLPELADRLRFSIPNFGAPDESLLHGTVATMLAIWREALKQPQASPGSDFFSLGGDSLSATRLIGAVNRAFESTLTPGMLMEAPTPATLARRVDERAGGGKPIQRIVLRPGDCGVPALLIPPWNSSCVLFRELARADGEPSCAVHALEGADERCGSGPAPSIEWIASMYATAIQHLYPAGGFRIGGYSMGGLIAWETARLLTATGRPPGCVVILDTPRIHTHLCVGEVEALAAANTLHGRLRMLAAHLIRPNRLGRRTILVQTLKALRRKAEGMQVHQSALRKESPWEPVYRRNIALGAKFVVHPHDGPVLLVRASEQVDWVPRFQEDLGWRKCCTGSFTVVDVPGDHVTMFGSENAPALLRAISTRID